MGIVIVAFIGGVLYVLIWMTCNLLTVRKVRIRNDDDVAKAAFVEILNSAQKTLLVRDDGDNSSTLYYDDDIVKQVRSCLESNPRLSIRVLFNDRGGKATSWPLCKRKRHTGTAIAWRYATCRRTNGHSKKFTAKSPTMAGGDAFPSTKKGRRNGIWRSSTVPSPGWEGNSCFRQKIADFNRQFQNAMP